MFSLIEPRAGDEVVHHRGGAGPQRLDGADHRAQIGLASGQLDGERRPHVLHPQFERQVLDAPLLEMLAGMKMSVDHAGHDQASAHVHDSSWS